MGEGLLQFLSTHWAKIITAISQCIRVAKYLIFYSLGCYLGCKIKKLHHLNELPVDEETVYLISLSPPIYSKRQWENVSKTRYKQRSLFLWKGVLLDTGEV